VYGTGSGSCPVAGFSTNDGELSSPLPPLLVCYPISPYPKSCIVATGNNGTTVDVASYSKYLPPKKFLVQKICEQIYDIREP
jgi:hypothetical protein